MIRIKELVELISGSPQFRITESSDPAAPSYFFYTQFDLEEDLVGLSGGEANIPSGSGIRKQVRTFDSVNTVSAGDVVFSLLSGKAAIVQVQRSGHLLTQNYVMLAPSKALDARYLVYLINESREIRRQFHITQQGSSVMKYTLAQVSSLELPPFPPLEKQALIGELYFNQLKLAALKKRAAGLETALVLAAIREANPTSLANATSQEASLEQEAQ